MAFLMQIHIFVQRTTKEIECNERSKYYKDLN